MANCICENCMFSSKEEKGFFCHKTIEHKSDDDKRYCDSYIAQQITIQTEICKTCIHKRACKNCLAERPVTSCLYYTQEPNVTLSLLQILVDDLQMHFNKGDVSVFIKNHGQAIQNILTLVSKEVNENV